MDTIFQAPVSVIGSGAGNSSGTGGYLSADELSEESTPRQNLVNQNGLNCVNRLVRLEVQGIVGNYPLYAGALVGLGSYLMTICWNSGSAARGMSWSGMAIKSYFHDPSSTPSTRRS